MVITFCCLNFLQQFWIHQTLFPSCWFVLLYSEEQLPCLPKGMCGLVGDKVSLTFVWDPVQLCQIFWDMVTAVLIHNMKKSRGGGDPPPPTPTINWAHSGHWQKNVVSPFSQACAMLNAIIANCVCHPNCWEQQQSKSPLGEKGWHHPFILSCKCCKGNLTRKLLGRQCTVANIWMPNKYSSGSC